LKNIRWRQAIAETKRRAKMKKTFLVLAMALCIAAPTFGARYRVSDAGIVQYKNTGAAIKSGDIVDLGYRYGIAAGDIASNATKSVFVDGIWLLARGNTNAIALGANVYQNSASNVIGTAGAGKYIGQCVEAVANVTDLTNILGQVDQFVKVDIGAPQRQIIVGTDIEAWDATLDTLSAGLASNKVWIGNASGEPAQQTLNGLFTITPGGVASASTTGAAVTGVATTAATVLSGLGSPTTVNAVTAYAAPQTADAIIALGTPTTADAVTSYGSPTSDTFVKEYGSPTTAAFGNALTLQTTTGYDSTGAAITNAAGETIAFVTNVTLTTANAITALGSATTASGLTALGTPTTAAAITGFAAHTTAAAVTNLGSATVSAVVTSYGSPTTDSVIDSVTPTTDTFVKP
jgi:predicted RecA/RadA family phage recombinase